MGCAEFLAGFSDPTSSEELYGIGELATSPQQAQFEKDRINAISMAIDAVMRRCYQPGSMQFQQWNATLAAWQAFYAAELGIFSGGFFGSGGVIDAARAFEERMIAFQKQAQADGCQVGPIIEPKEDPAAALSSTVKFVAVGVVAAAAVIALKSVL
jgi:hypothetical protein